METSAGGAPVRPAGPRGGRTLAVIALLAAAYLAYSPALDGELQFDDLRSIAANPAIKDFSHLARLGLDDVLGASRPLVDLTFALNYRAGGLAVRPYHLVNLGLHLGAVLAVLALALEILRRAGWPAPFAPAWLTAALFGLHPLQSQAVAYVCQRAEVLAALLYLLGLLLALRAVAGRGAAAAGAWLAALFCVLLGWETKPTLATFPAGFLLCAAAFPGVARATGRKLVLASLPFWATSALFSSRLLWGVSGTGHAGFDLPQLSAGRYFLTQSRVVLTYLRLLFWPAGQNVDWDFAPSASALEPRTAPALLAVAMMISAAAWLWRWSARAPPSQRRTLTRLGAFGILWFLVILAPTSSVVPVADVIAEHRVYLAGFGIFLPVAAVAVALGRSLAGERMRLLAAAAAALLLLALGAALYRRAQVWQSAVSLWSDAAAKSPRKARPHMNLGYALTPVDPARAVDEYRLALTLGAGDLTINHDELKQDLAGALLGLRRYGEAIAILRELAAAGPPTPQLETNLAIAYLENGQLDEARAAASRAAARFPGYAPAWHTLGQLAFARGEYAEARLDFGRASSIDPDSIESLSSLAVTSEKLGDRESACRTWQRYLRAAGAAVDAARQRMATLGCAADR